MTAEGAKRPNASSVARNARPIGAELASWRQRMGLTQAATASRLRVPLRSLQGWELGRPCAMPDLVLRCLWFESGCPFDEEPGMRAARNDRLRRGRNAYKTKPPTQAEEIDLMLARAAAAD